MKYFISFIITFAIYAFILTIVLGQPWWLWSNDFNYTMARLVGCVIGGIRVIYKLTTR